MRNSGLATTHSQKVVPGEAELISAEKAIPVLDPKPEEFSEVAARLRDAGVRNILLIHARSLGGYYRSGSRIEAILPCVRRAFIN